MSSSSNGSKAALRRPFFFDKPNQQSPLPLRHQSLRFAFCFLFVARTGNDTWKLPTGPEAYLPSKELRTVGNRRLREVWEDMTAVQIHDVFDFMSVRWTSMDLVRIGVVGESVAPVIVWISVKPDTISGKDGIAAAKECKELLVANDIYDVEVEIRESVVWGSRAVMRPEAEWLRVHKDQHKALR